MVESCLQARVRFFRWRCSLVLVHRLALALAMAGTTGLAAQVQIPLPWTPVPITGQTLAVLLSGVLLGRWWGGLSQAMYVAMGVAGVPWFAGWTGGHGALIGPTGGYLLGFVLAALFLGHFTDLYVRARGFVSSLALLLFANFFLIHLPGLVQLRLWLELVGGAAPSLGDLLWMGTLPFVAGDLAKIAAAAALVKAISPKEPFGSTSEAGPHERR